MFSNNNRVNIIGLLVKSPKTRFMRKIRDRARFCENEHGRPLFLAWKIMNLHQQSKQIESR
jgi:hypothetical protein